MGGSRRFWVERGWRSGGYFGVLIIARWSSGHRYAVMGRLESFSHEESFPTELPFLDTGLDSLFVLPLVLLDG